MHKLKEDRFRSFDNLELFYRVWEPATPSDQAVIILHRGHEHSGRVQHLVEELNLEGKWVFAFDLRGHGLSPGSRGWAPSFDTWVKDLNAFSVFIRIEYGLKMENTLVVANSVGSVMAVQWVHDYAPGIRGLILAAPAFKIKLYVPLALTFLKLGRKFSDQLFVNSYVRSNMLTRDPVHAKSYDEDKLITKRIAVNVLVSLFESAKRLLADAESIDVPLLVLSSGNDFVVDNKAQKKFFDKVSSAKKEFIEFPGFRHAIFHEKDREQVVGPARKFIAECFQVKKNLPMIIPQPREFSVRVVQQLAAKPPAHRQLGYYFLRKSLEIFGPVSEGMRIGLQYGFDSGISLDYIYKNKPQGKYFIGKIIDFFYLNAVGWRGIRQRKSYLKDSLRKAIETVVARGEKPVILDCAAGCGRYLFETIHESKHDVEVHVRDINPDHLEVAQQTAEGYGIKATFEKADAFDPKSYIDFKLRPNIVIVSGLFELFSDNNLLHQTLLGIKSLMRPEGFILYTGQPWHPQLELIGRVLNNHLGRRWIMRPRVQSELDELVKYVGFDKLDTVIDDLGIFTVSVAKNEKMS